ncbi:hypothetical protein C8R44DRAFT_812289 [Mycena epipterygia]|nr:hypothetical protein C8R44DRAFT_812289 [Mycena epipterygia]
MPALPQELIDAVIKDVPESSLAACSLTATAFVTSSQRRLFRRMSLSKITAYERTADVLASSPHLGSYVLSLALDIKELPNNYPLLKSILAPFTKIERLSIAGDDSVVQRITSNICLLDLLDLPSLKCLALHNLRVPRSLVAHALGTFDQVSLSHLTTSLGDAPIPTAIPPRANLWHLHTVENPYDGVLAFLLDPMRFAYFKKLARLTLTFASMPDALPPRVMALLSCCAGTLNHLELQLSTPIDLPPLPAIRSLELRIDNGTLKNPTLFASMVSRATAPTPHLAVLTLAISVRFHYDGLYHWANGVSSPEPWHTLDSALLAISSLCEVQFALRHFKFDPERYQAFVPHVASRLPLAQSAGLLRFSCGPLLVHPLDWFVDE